MSTDQEIIAALGGAAWHMLRPFRQLSAVQRLAIPALLERRPGLLIAPTASGKTEAALAPLLELQRREGWRGEPVILHIVPTRALVNDLHRRLAPVLGEFMRVGRRTAEHHEDDADLLLTTPESLDSMLARGSREAGHRLGQVRAVVLDELHLLAGSARGAQLQVLLARLQEVARQAVMRVGLSATVEDAERLARRFLGPDAVVLSAGGGRRMVLDRVVGDEQLPERPPQGADPLAREFWRIDRGQGAAGLEPLVRRLLRLRDSSPLKALVFVPSRARCDHMTAQLKHSLAGQSPVRVFGHHGSLSQQAREATEAQLCTAPESVVVATSTLELGIDIGDINLVVLDGPPSSTASLLQRLGRASRRGGAIRVMPLCGGAGEAYIFASMFRWAIEGRLEREHEAAHLSIVVQQVASALLQTRRGKLRRSRFESWLVDLFHVPPEQIVRALLTEGLIVEQGADVLMAGEALRELIETPLMLHSNIGSVGRLLPLVDALTGDVMAWAPRQGGPGSVALAGSVFRMVQRDDVIELHQEESSVPLEHVRYASTKMPVQRDTLRHLCLGLGLGEHPLIIHPGGWLHFGGAIFGEILCQCGVPSSPLSSGEDPRCLRGTDLMARLRQRVDKVLPRLERLFGFGPHHGMLPASLRQDAVLASLAQRAVEEWLDRLEVSDPDPEQQAVISQVVQSE